MQEKNEKFSGSLKIKYSANFTFMIKLSEF